MSQWLCTSKIRNWRTGWLSGLAGAALLSTPAMAETQTTPVAPIAPDAVAADNEPVEVNAAKAPDTVIAAAQTAQLNCAPVRMASIQRLAPAAAPATFSKSSAILGGGLSSLDRIRLAQSGGAPTSAASLPAPSQLATSSVATTQIGTQLQADTFAPVEAPLENCVQPHAAASNIPATADNRLILGSLRLAIHRTPFDQQWSKVSRAGSARGLKRYLSHIGARASDTPRQHVEAVNSWVNGQISYTDDIALYRQNDFWASSRETLRRRKGDCEDYAILKMDMLAAMGVDRDRMILVVARDLVRNADHAVLVVQLEDGPVVLDNSTDRLLDGRLAHDYRPIMSFANNGKWLHGYAMAAAEPQPAPVSVPVQTTAPVVSIAALSVPSMPATALSAPVSIGN
jgi:predicted transglutaminase-like cysteine proteinase